MHENNDFDEEMEAAESDTEKEIENIGSDAAKSDDEGQEEFFNAFHKVCTIYMMLDIHNQNQSD